MRLTKREAIAELAERFQRNGHVRHPSAERRKEAGTIVYKKGYEVRLIAHSEKELAHIQKLLDLLGFRFGEPYPQAGHFRQPIYGREQVERFLSLIGETIAWTAPPDAP
ncbi:MAG: hypothetical protein HYV63_00955 [Candidatus Schekmanbacteria bacterium]|nr:hypothetical protein [Candidatus Schekmanbacteria bacterium]